MGLIALGEANWREEEIGSRRLVRKWTRRAFVTRIGTEAVGMKQKGTGPGQRQGFGSGGEEGEYGSLPDSSSGIGGIMRHLVWAGGTG